MNLPNLLTLLRIFFVPLLVAALVERNSDWVFGGQVVSSAVLALGVFWAAALTDLLDGYLARRWGQVVELGAILPSNLQQILKPRCSYKRRPSALSFQQGVGGDGGAVYDFRFGSPGGAGDAGENHFRGVGRIGPQLEGFQAAVGV